MTTSLRNIFKRVNDSFRNTKQISPESELAMADRLYNLGRTKAAEGKHGSAVRAYHKALEYQRRHLGEDCPEAGRTLNDIGASLMQWRDGQEHFAALTAFKEALYIRQAACGDGSEEAAETMSNMITLLNRLREREKRDSADDGVLEASSPSCRKSSISSSTHSQASRRLSATISEAIEKGRRRSTVALGTSEQDRKLSSVLAAELGDLLPAFAAAATALDAAVNAMPPTPAPGDDDTTVASDDDSANLADLWCDLADADAEWNMVSYVR